MQKLLSSIQSENRSPHKVMIATIATVLTCGTLLWLGALITHNKKSVETSSGRIVTDKTNPPLKTDHIDQLETEDRSIISYSPRKTASEGAAAYQKFTREITLATQAIDNSNSKVNEIVQQLTSIQACLAMSYLMIRDFFTGSTEVEKLFKTETEELERITSNAIDQAKQSVDRLQTALQIPEGIYTETHIAGPERIATTGVPDNIDSRSQTRELHLLESNQTISLASTAGSASAIISATTLAKTVTHSAWSLLAETRLRAAKRMAVAASPAIIDGPLPFGDMLAVALESGCLLWSFHEVYDAQGTLKNNLQDELTWLMRQNSKNIREWAMSVGNELMEIAALPPQK